MLQFNNRKMLGQIIIIIKRPFHPSVVHLLFIVYCYALEMLVETSKNDHRLINERSMGGGGGRIRRTVKTRSRLRNSFSVVLSYD